MIPYFEIQSFQIGDFTIYTWGAAVALGLIISIFLLLLAARKQGFASGNIMDLILISLIFGFIGARVGYVISQWPYYIAHPAEIIQIWQGGLGFVPGFIAATLADAYYIKVNSLNFAKIADLFAPYLALAYGISRIGCFLIHDHLGRVTKMPWGIEINGKGYNDAGLYGIINGLTLFIFLIIMRRYIKNDGLLAAIGLLYYSIVRFIIELFQTGPYLAGITYTGWMVFFLGLWSLLYIIELKKVRG